MADFSLVAGNNRLFGAAAYYGQLGFSVIPIWGNIRPEQPKAAAVDWKIWQYRRADINQLSSWFTHNRYGGLALVTGSISRLLVLDFDRQELADEFRKRYPELAKTRVVRSAGRGLPHFYYRLPHAISITSRRVAGLDLLADGRYVVAPPTAIGDVAYEVVQSGQALLLDAAQIEQIQAFVSELDGRVALEPTDPTAIRRMVTADQLLGNLRTASSSGRNQALFETACMARDAGWTVPNTTALLLPHFVRMRGLRGAPETLARREQEGMKTIASAFSRPARRSTVQAETSNALPTVLREHFLQTRRTYLARVLDGLLMADFKPGEPFTEKQIVDALAGQVGRYSILKALQECDPAGNPVFACADPSPAPLTHTTVASACADLANNTCILFRATASNKNQKGRPPKTYTLPRMDQLCQRFSVRMRGADVLQPQDLSSPAAYRRALHRELIRRRPGTYAVSWLAKRLGASSRTIQRYQAGGELRTRPSFMRRVIGWGSLNLVPDDRSIYGVFLEDDQGKRYPALRAIAARLLKLGRSIACVRQRHNTYYHKDQPIYPFSLPVMPAESRYNGQNSRFPALCVQVDVMPEKSAEKPVLAAFKPAPPAVPASLVRKEHTTVKTAPLPAVPQRSKRYYRLPLPDLRLEEAAQTLYERIRARCEQKNGYLSRARARLLAERYGAEMLKRLLNVLRWREGIENPAGFVTVWLRSEALKLELAALT